MDDSSYNLFIMTEILQTIRDITINVDTCMDGQEAIEKVMGNLNESIACDYNIIFMDINMPIMGGVEVSLIVL